MTTTTKKGTCDWCEADATRAMGSAKRFERACAAHARNLRVPPGSDGDSYPDWHWHSDEGWVPTVIGITPCCANGDET